MFCLSRLRVLTLAVLGAAALGACAPRVAGTGGQTPATPTTPQQNQQQIDLNKPVTVALLAPSTASNGGAAALGRALGNAARMAAADLGDPRLQLRIYDTGGNAGQARQAAERAIREGAKLIVGPLFGANTKAIASAAAAANIKVLSFSTDASVAGDPVYLTGFLPEMAARRITSFARSRGYGQIALFYPQNAYGEAALRGAQSGARTALVTSQSYPRTSEGIPPASKQFTASAQAAGARAIVLAESGQALQFVGSLMQSNGLSPREIKYLGLGEWNSRATLGEGSLRGGWFAGPDPQAMQRFVEKYKERYSAVPPPLAVLGYDAVQIAGRMLQDARASGSSTPFSTASLTRPSGFNGAVGPIRFTPDGLGERGMAVLEVRRGGFTTIDAVPTRLGLGS